ncbi:MAG: ankyrin repeat domain-containing protein [Gammaproteobacteria bacterium]|nr:ankyrin repeat domain-containing protein [Gammaproteobacteria bacterium]
MKIKILISIAIVLSLTACGKPDEPTIGLYPAINNDDINQINRHIRWGTDINQVDPEGQRPLHIAAMQGSQVIVKLLLKNGADIDAPNSHDRSALYVAVMNGRTRVAELLIKEGARFNADKLLDAAVDHDLVDRDVIQLLVSRGATINRVDATGSTPLLKAIDRENRILVKHLVAQGADVNLIDNNGTTPLAAAIASNNDDIQRMLRRNGARLTP